MPLSGIITAYAGWESCFYFYGRLRVKPGFHSNAIAALRALRKRKAQETQALALASSQSWLPLLRPSIPIGWRLRLLRENANASDCV